MNKYAGLVFSFLVFVACFTITGCNFAFNQVPAAIDSVTTSVGGWVGVSALLTAGLELLVRIVPTANPWSFLLVASEMGHALGRFFEGTAKFLDGLGLQKLKR